MAAPVLNGHFTKLSHGGVVPQKEAMKYEALRVASFQTFPKSVPKSALKLASAGFYYIGKDDEVECFDCVLKLKDWGSNDDPFEVHKRYSADCPYINNNAADNVPLASKGVSGDPVQAAATQFSRLSTNSTTASNPQSDAVQELKGRGNTDGNLTQVQSQNPSVPGVNSNSAESQAPTFNPARNSVPETSSTFPPQPQRESRRDYRYERSRLASFQNWPSNAVVRPEELAKSGFYYTGTDDRVQCTFCRGILGKWEPSDQADAEHRRHFGQCPFLNNPYSVGNVAIGDEYKKQDKNDPDFQDYCQSIVTDKPVHQRYSLPADRLGTFKDFPTNMTQTPEQFPSTGTDQGDKKSVSARPGRMEIEDREYNRFVQASSTSRQSSAVVSGATSNHQNQRQAVTATDLQLNLISMSNVKRPNVTDSGNREVNLRNISHVTNSPTGNHPYQPSSTCPADLRSSSVGVQCTESHGNQRTISLRNYGRNIEEQNICQQGGPRAVCQQKENVPTNNTVPFQQIFLTGFQYPVRRKTVRRVMKTDLVRAVVKQWCNIPESDMAVVVRKRLEQLNEPFPNFESLMEAVYEYQEDLCRAEKIRLARRAEEIRLARQAEEIRLARQQHIANLLKSRDKIMKERVCKICLERDTTVAFLKCGHLFCGQCAIWVMGVGRNRCPICRQIIVRLLAIERVSS